jgi:hypothetical protein
MIQNFIRTSLVGGLLLGSMAFANPLSVGEECSSTQECPTSKKVSALILRWEGAQLQQQALTPAARQQGEARMASVAESCPVGSRLGDSLAAVRDVLGVIQASQVANAEHCPLANAPDSEACTAGKQLKAARIQVVEQLHQLASYAAGGTACCASKASADCDAAASVCPIKVASRVGAMKASFASACKEAQALTPEARGAILAGFANLSESNPGVVLVPATVEALAEGFEVLAQIQTRMGEWAHANPEIVGKLPASAFQAYMMEVSLAEEARQLLAATTQAMKTMQTQGAATAALAGSR